MTISRTIAIGDLHGCLAAFDTLLAAIQPTSADTIITLGDYVDRGLKSREVVDRLLELQKQCQLISLLGNHDELLLMVHDGHSEYYDDWLRFGGNTTLASYGTPFAEDIPDDHIAFLRGCRLYHETDSHIFMHGTYLDDLPLAEQPRNTLLWESIKTCRPGPHCSGKTAIVGHTSQKNGEVLDFGYLKCIDTCCYGNGYLTAFDIAENRYWQADKNGKMK